MCEAGLWKTSVQAWQLSNNEGMWNLQAIFYRSLNYFNQYLRPNRRDVECETMYICGLLPDCWCSPKLYNTFLVFCDSLTEESWDLQRDRRSTEAPALRLILWWSTSCLGPCLEHSCLHSCLVGLHRPAALKIPVVEDEEWAPLSIISHSPCH